MSTSWLKKLALGCLVGAGPITSAAAEQCTPIRFVQGQGTARIRALAPPTEDVCFSLPTHAGQSAVLKLVIGSNIDFSVGDGLVDGRDYSFVADGRVYRIDVGQRTAAEVAEPFVLVVTLR